jgi:hypothetical protein
MDAERGKRDGGSGGAAEREEVKPKKKGKHRLVSRISLFEYEPDFEKVENAVLGKGNGAADSREG